MKLNRMTGPLLALALIFAPAVPAFAKPVSTHIVQMDWSTNQSGILTNGFIAVSHDGSDPTSVELLVVQNMVAGCDGGSMGTMSRSVSHSGPADVVVTIDRHMDEASIVGSVSVTESTSVWCPGTGTVETVQQTTIDLDMVAVAIDRPVRSRDRDTGTRTIVRPADLTLLLGSATFVDQALLTEEISPG